MSEAALRRGKITQEDRAASFPPYPDDWYIEDEEQVSESRPHDLEGEHLRQLLLGWQARFHVRAAIGRNIAVRSDQTHPGTGVDPDVYVLENPPAGFDFVSSMRLWESGYYPPLLCIEIVSESRPEKDYTQSPLKYSVNGTQELWIFDPKMCRRPKYGEPIRLQVWRRDDNGSFERVYAGEGPVYSEAVHAWLFVTNEGQNINIADDAEGTQWWMTPAEQEREAKLEERAAKEKERAAKEAALAAKDDERAAKEAALAAKEAALAAKDAERAAKDAALEKLGTAQKTLDDERAVKEQALARIAELEELLARRA
jgi:Uma2 family endonuclease